MVNSAYTVHKTNGTPVSNAYHVNDVFDEGASEFTSDPRCQCDAATHPWYATILYLRSDSTSSGLDIAVDTSGDPTRAWGDDSSAILDPSGKSVWGAVEYMPPVSSQTPDGQRNWGTRVLDVPTQ